jgi:phage terminase large subunit-like protein
MSTLQGELDRLGVVLPFEPFGQGFVSMAPAIDTTEIEFLHGRVRHGRHPVLTMCAANAVMVMDPAGNRKLDKAKSTGRIDGMVGLVMAMSVAIGEKPAEEAPKAPQLLIF